MVRSARYICALSLLVSCAGEVEPVVGEGIVGTDDEAGCTVEAISQEEAALVLKNAVHASDGPPLTIFLNRHGGTYRGGANDSANNRSSLVRGSARLPAFARGDESWRALVECVTENYARFNVHITDLEPAGGRYIEAVIGGHPSNIGRGGGIGGIAPINTNSCRPIETAVGYVFSANLSSARLCKVTTHEIGHMLSLEHEYLCEDPMTYLSGCGRKTFQDEEVMCGTNSRRRCSCRGGRQNTVATLFDLVGRKNRKPPPDPVGDRAPPTVELEQPADRDSFAEHAIVDVVATAHDDVLLGRVELVWDFNGQTYGCPTRGENVTCTRTRDRFHWKVQVGTGQRTFRVRALDYFGKEAQTEDRTILLTGDGAPPPELDDQTPPEVRIVGPEAGLRFDPGGQIVVEATVTDDGELAGVHLLWAFNGEEYACPRRGQPVECEVAGDTRRWTVTVGAEDERRFQVRARDTAGRVTTSEARTVFVTEVESAPPPADPEDPPPPADPEDPPPPPDDPDPGAPPPEDPPDAPPPEDPPPPDAPEDPERPPPPNAPDAPDAPEDPPAPEDNGVPTIEVLGPADGTVRVTDSSVEVSARVTDVEGVRSAQLLWAYNEEQYGCPVDGRHVSCVVDGEVYRWTVTLGRAAPRPFRIRARNTRGRETTTPERTVEVRDSLDGDPPRVTLLEPTPETRWPADSVVSVTAEITDDGRVADAQLVWAYNDNEYPCPHRSQYVDCDVEGDRYAWRVTVSDGSRTFQIRAADEAGNQTLTEPRTLELDP